MRKMFGYSRWRRAAGSGAAVLLLAIFTAIPATAETIAGPVLDEIHKMLQAEMAEEIILKWLATHEAKPRRPDANDLIALKEAGASDDLLATVLELAAEPASGAAAEPEPTVAGPQPASTVRPAEPSEAAEDGTIPIHFEISYRPDFDEDEPEWGLYVYIDGEPLTYVPAGSLLSSSKLRFRHYLAPGQHTLKVAQERHEKRWADRWFHAARMSATDFPFQLTEGRSAEVLLEFRQPQLAFGSWKEPLSFRFVQGKTVQVHEDVGGDPEDWALVCEEIEANVKDGKLKRALRQQLDDCRRWSELWGDARVPSRDEVREALALFRYRPVPKDQPLD